MFTFSFSQLFQDREEQARLEMKHRKEEDDLYRKFARKREDEERKITSEMQDEWERELERLTHKFEKELATSRRSREDQNILTLRHEQQKEDLEKNMTLRKTKKKESLTRKMLEHERSETAALVDRQSSEMLELISARRSEFMQNESIFLDDEFNETTQPLMSYPSSAPQPQPPAVSKFQIYTDPIEFEEVDRIAISVRSFPSIGFDWLNSLDLDFTRNFPLLFLRWPKKIKKRSPIWFGNWSADAHRTLKRRAQFSVG